MHRHLATRELTESDRARLAAGSVTPVPLTPSDRLALKAAPVAESAPMELTAADRLALHAAGLPSPLMEKGGDHYYGAWKGGKASGGGGPDKNGDGKVDAPKTIFGKSRDDFPTLAQARAKGKMRPGLGADHPSEVKQARAMGLKKDAVTGRWYKPGGSAPRAPQLPKDGKTREQRLADMARGERNAKRRAARDDKRFYAGLKAKESGGDIAWGDTEVRALQVIHEGDEVTGIREAIVMLDKAPQEAKVLAVGDDILVIPCWTGAFDHLTDAYVKPEPYVPSDDYETEWNVTDAADLLSKLARMKRREGDEADQQDMLQTAIVAIADYLKVEADELSDEDDETCDCGHPADCDCTTCSCDGYGGHTGAIASSESIAEAIAESTGDGPFAAAILEVGKRNSAADMERLRKVKQLLDELGLELPEPVEDPAGAVEPVAEASVDDGTTPESITFREAGAYGDYVTLAEAAPQFDVENRTVWVTPIKPGWGNTRDNNFYPTEAVREATEKGLFNHLKMFKDHPRRSDEKELPERSVKDWFATTREAVWDEARQKPRVPIVVHDDADFRRMQEAPEQVAFSILGGGMARPGTVDGRKGRILESISKVRSVDWVTEAGAGGGIDFAESASSIEESYMDGIEELTAEQLAEGNPELYEKLVSTGKALALAATAIAPTPDPKKAKADADETPDPAKAETDTKESGEVPAWFAPFAQTLTAIATREAAAGAEADKAKAKTVVAATLQGSTLTDKQKAIIGARFTEAAIGEGAYADEDAVKAAVEGAIKEAEDLIGTAPKKGNVVGLGEGAASTDSADVSVREAVKGDIESRWGSEVTPRKDQLVFTPEQLTNAASALVPVAGAGAPKAMPVSEAGAEAEASLAARF